MRNRRFVSTSDEEDDAPPPPPNGDENKNQRKRKKVHLHDEEDDEEKEIMEEPKLNEQSKKHKKNEEAANEDEQEEDDDEVEAQPLGEVVRVSGKGKGMRNHYASFEYDGLEYELEDPVLLAPDPEQGKQKPYVMIIKDIAQTLGREMKVTGQWFYRPEEAIKKGGGSWQSSDTRELFYSFHRDEVPAEAVMHKCVVHFIPQEKQIPQRKQHPGFIVQKVYDTIKKKLFKLTDKDYEDDKQHEIDLLVQKTLARLGDLPDLEPKDATMDHKDHVKNKRLLKMRNVSPLDVSRKDEGLCRSQSFKVETPGSAGGTASEYYAILSKFKLLTGDTQRDKWLEKLLQSVQFICIPKGIKQNDEDKQGGNKNGGPNESPDKGDASFEWPDAAVPAVAALEKAAHDTLSAVYQKYNQKMRQLTFNLESNALLTRRLLNKELEPAQILNMSPNELKEGLTAEERESSEPEESGRMQMTDARCKRCNEKKVGLIDIIQTGHTDRYQLECVACGNVWYASRDDAATLTIEGPSSGKTVGIAPLATAKFEDIEKKLVSPRGAEKGSNDVLKKTTEAYVPILDNQRSFNKTRPEESLATTKAK